MRKKRLLHLVLVVLALVVLLAGCDLLGGLFGASIRFQNVMSDGFSFGYGLRFGDAEFLFVPLDPFGVGESTDYDTTPAGSHSVQGKTNAGDWLTISAGSFDVDAGNKYTIAVSGTIDAMFFQLIQD